MPAPSLARAEADEDPTQRRCRLLGERDVDAIERLLRKQYDVTWTPSKVVVDFGCDRLGAVREIHFETGSGHGGSLVLYRLTRLGRVFDVRALAFSRSCVQSGDTPDYHDEGACKVHVARSEVPQKPIDDALERMRTAMVSSVKAIALMPSGNRGLGAHGTFSSGDFHLRITLSDEATTLDRQFTGYGGTTDQEARLPMEIASRPLQDAVAPLQFTDAPVDEADRAFFAQRMLATFHTTAVDRRGRPQPSWWVRERYLAMATRLGSPALVPLLVSLAEERGSGDGPANRPRVEAVNALAFATGFDARFDEAGRPRPLEDVVRDYAAECRRD